MNENDRPKGMAALRAIVAAYDDALTTHIYDEGNGEEVPDDETALVDEASAALRKAEARHDALELCLTQMEQCAKMFRDDDDFQAALKAARRAL
jgi:hypothetical protein